MRKSTMLAVTLLVATSLDAQGTPLRLCATTPDLGDLASAVGGGEVAVTTLVKPAEDPHFVEAKPSFVKVLSTADVLVVNGLELEVGWLPALQAACRNAAVQNGGAGFVDASGVIKPLEVPTGAVDRSMGDVHAAGNPHYLLDPLNGLRVAALLRDRLAKLRPAAAKSFEANYDAFRAKLGDALVGPDLARKYDFEKLALLHEHRKLAAFLEGRGDRDKLGGWFKLLLPHAGVKAVGDHNLWPYFARRFGIDVAGFLEPKPGVPPTTRHLTELVRTMQAQQVRLVLAAPYYDRRHADFVASRTGARVATMAHQTGARPGAADYLSTVDQNVRAVVAALGAS
jgi:ABC-type Zn uptake system ZnuABC Zn-binding protein ZnuA